MFWKICDVFHRQTLVLNTGIPACFCTMFWQKKANMQNVLKNSPYLSQADISAEHRHSCRLLHRVLTEESEYAECSERFALSFSRVVSGGEKFNNCACADRWEWVSVKGSQIGVVGDMKSWWDTQNTLFVCNLCVFWVCFLLVICNTNNDIIFSMMKRSLQKKKITWAGSESLWDGEEVTSACGFMVLQLSLFP